MIKKLFTCVLFVLIALLSGCSRVPIMADRVLVKNASNLKVTEVKVLHEPTNRVGAVNAILPNESLDIGFPKQPLLARRAIIHWIDGNGQSKSGELEVPYDAASAKAEKAMSLVYVLHPSGFVTAQLLDSMLLDY